MPRQGKFFANIVSTRDNGARIELNLRGTYYIDPGRYSGPPELCYEAESEINITRCDIIEQRAGTNKVWCTSVDFYDIFSIDEQERFLEAAFAAMEDDI